VEQLLTSAKSNAEIVEALYLATLSRPPTTAERQTAMGWLDADRKSAEDLQWALLNKVDFVFNH
jgi:hypothetical protein